MAESLTEVGVEEERRVIRTGQPGEESQKMIAVNLLRLVDDDSVV